MKRVMDLAGWPPEGGAGAYDPRGGTFAISIEQVRVKEVLRVSGSRVDFNCLFEDKDNPVVYRFFATDQKTAEDVAAILRSNIGNTLFSVGMVELPS